MLNIDSGGVQSRRVLDRIVAAEQAAAGTAETTTAMPMSAL